MADKKTPVQGLRDPRANNGPAVLWSDLGTGHFGLAAVSAPSSGASGSLADGQATASTTPAPLQAIGADTAAADIWVQNDPASTTNVFLGTVKGTLDFSLQPGEWLSIWDRGPFALSTAGVYISTAAGTATVNWLARGATGGTVTSIGTAPTALGSNACAEVVVMADPANTQNLLIGGTDAQRTVLTPGDTRRLAVSNTNLIFYKAAQAGGTQTLYWQARSLAATGSLSGTVSLAAGSSIKITDGTNTGNVTPATSVSNAVGAQAAQLVAGAFAEQTGLSAGSLNAFLVPATDVSQYRWLSLQVTAVAGGGTLQFQGSNDNTNWIFITLANSQSSAAAVTSNTSATGIFHGPVAYRYFRVQQTAWTSGSSTGTLELYTQPAALQSQGVGAAQSGTWTVQPGNTANTTAWLVSQGAAANPTATTLQSAVTANGNGTALASAGYKTAVFNVTASVTMSGGTTVNFEVSPDGGTTWNALWALPDGAGTPVTTTLIPGVFRASLPGTNNSQIRARISNYSAGTVTVTGALAVQGSELVVGASLLTTLSSAADAVSSHAYGHSYTNISTATTTVIASAPGTIRQIRVLGGTMGNVTVYDNTAGSGTTIIPAVTPAQGNVLCEDTKFVTGLTIVTAAATILLVTIGPATV